MQYALLDYSNEHAEPYQFLVDANELHALYGGPDKLQESEPPQEDESIPFKLVYGVYKPQPFLKFPKNEIKRHILESLNKWLIHLDGNKTIYLGIEDIECLDITVMTSCGHCPKPHVSSDVAFAALIRVPDSITLGNGKTQAKTAYLKWFNQDPLTNLINRKGLFSFVAAEKRIKKELTLDNWKSFIDYKRAVRYAQKFR
ncbi:hypothetical protein [Photobacterium phosphoreum]|uniref:hypothetical protein n=1 Tax=Photobacterium phosphoreum TaxID=659 RepID=UPI001E5E716A|nr:hypothetical protein [Photobacterium phosphoreum]MCD9477095.1 hypothetical protein [Photobacterium phosphoreum]MCF2177866.1 hypothetical protein [Photobacterium phosphoreum]